MKFSPRYDKLYLWITVPTSLMLLGLLLLAAIEGKTALWLTMGGTVLLTGFFLISPCFGYAELKEKTLLIRFGLFMKREIPYESIFGIEKKRSAIADSMLSLKNAMEHINIKFNRYDLYSVSLKNEDLFTEELKKRCGIN